MTTHDLTPHLPLLRSEAGREILGDTRLEEHPGGQFIVSHGVYWKAEAVPLDVYHAIAFRALRRLRVQRGHSEIFTELAWHKNFDPDAILTEAVRFSGVEKPTLADSTERTEVTTGPRTKTTSIVLNERGRDSVSVEGGEG